MLSYTAKLHGHASEADLDSESESESESLLCVLRFVRGARCGSLRRLTTPQIAKRRLPRIVRLLRAPHYNGKVTFYLPSLIVLTSMKAIHDSDHSCSFGYHNSIKS